MLAAGVGTGEGSDSYAVGVEAVTIALSELRTNTSPDVLPSACILFASAKYDHEAVLKGIQSVIGTDVIITGASTAGEITQIGPTRRESAAVMLLWSDDIRFSSAEAHGIHEGSIEAGKSLGEQLRERGGDDLRLVSMNADGLKGNGSAIIRGILSVLGSNFPVVGGSAGDDGKFVKTHQFHGANVFSDSVVALGMSGNLDYAVGVNHGWNPVGAPRTVTDATGSVVKTINDQPAFNLYRDYLGDEANGLKEYTLGEIALSYPLGIFDETSETMMLRAPLAVNEDESITFGGEVPVGSRIQLMVGNKEDAIAAAARAAETAQQHLDGKASAALVFSCHVRNTLYGDVDTAKGEVDAIQSVIGRDVPLLGFYTYAEQAPIGGTSLNMHTCDAVFHNETVVLVLLRSG